MNDAAAAAHDSAFATLLRRALGALLIGGTAVVVLQHWLGVGSGLRFEIGGALYDAVLVGAGLACLFRASRFGLERGAWLLLGAAILAWGLGEAYWSLALDGQESMPHPALADAGYLAFYPLAYAGLALLVRARAHEMNWRHWMDAAIAALGAAALAAALVFDLVAERAAGTPLQVLVTLAYPLGDITMIALVVGVLALTGWRPGRTWSLLLAGLASLAVADIAFTLQAVGGSLPAGRWTDPIYLAAAVCLAAAVWQPAGPAEITSPRRGDRRRELIVPAIFAAVMVGLFGMQYLGLTSGLSTVLWAATTTAVIFRLAFSDRENKALLEQVRTDSLTGLGNRGRLEAELPGRFARASAAQPLQLLLFDLDGFKRYNDTFGHPAGDDLLARFGATLREALGEDGVAYRIGGDEFCVVLTCPGERFEAATGRAAAALSAGGNGYRVAPSWGAVRVPAEESEPGPALQLADARMYAQKGSQRGGQGSGRTPPHPLALRAQR